MLAYSFCLSNAVNIVLQLFVKLYYFMTFHFRTLYWSDPGRSVIESSYMNGDNRTVLPIEYIEHPNHLFIDFRFDE